MAAPAIIELIMQKSSGDCVIAALAMVLALPFVEVHVKAQELYPDCSKSGLTTREMLRVTRALGRNLSRVPLKDLQLDAETGLLDVRIRSSYHAVCLFEGVVVNPADGLIYTLDAYLASAHAKPTAFFRP